MLKAIANTKELENVDLAVAAKDYLLSGGMTAEQIETLKANLSTEIATSIVENTEEVINTDNDNKEDTTVVTYIVVKGDCLWNIAKKLLGDGNRYIEIYKLNENIIKNPNMIHIGQNLVLPVK